VFTHTATEDNTFLHATAMDHPAVNGDPDAIIVVTQVYNPDGEPAGVENNDFVQVSYGDSGGEWLIFNANVEAMPVGAAFNVLVAEPGDTAFIHQADTTFHTTGIDRPALNDNPSARPLVTRHDNPGGSGTPQVPNAIAVGYAGSQWFIRAFSGSGAEEIPEGAAFNVIVPDDSSRTFVHRVRDSNISAGGDYSWIDLPVGDAGPNARVFLAHLAPSDPHVSLSAPFGALYDLFNGQWGVFRQDDGAMAEDMYFLGYVASGSDSGNVIFQDRFEMP